MEDNLDNHEQFISENDLGNENKIILPTEENEEVVEKVIKKENVTIRELSILAEKILNNIKEIKNNVEVVISRNEKDFLIFLESILDKLIKDTKSKINEIEYNFELTRKRENVKNILKEREFYESEARRLDKYNTSN